MNARRFALCLLLAGASLLAACQSGGGLQIGNVDLGAIAQGLGKLRDVKEPEEIEIGGSMVETLLGASPLLDDPELQKYVNDVGMWVAQQSERPNLPWHFGVNSSDHINAFAAPGGYIIVTRGMLMQLRNEAELAGVLGHEIAHVTRKHHLNALKKSGLADLLGEALAASSEKHGDMVRQLAGPTKELYARGLDKGDEFEADRVGVVLAARAGYDAYGLPGVLTTLATADPKDNFLSLLYKTHPLPEARLDKLAPGLVTLESLKAAQNAERFEKATRKLRIAAK